MDLSSKFFSLGGAVPSFLPSRLRLLTGSHDILIRLHKKKSKPVATQVPMTIRLYRRLKQQSG